MQRDERDQTQSRGQHPRRKTILQFLSILIIASVGTAAGLSASNSIVGKEYQSGIELSGIVTDTDCGGTHGTKTHGDAECIRACVRLGAEYALAVGKNVYVLKGHQQELNEFAGDKVLVSGVVVGGDTVVVESVVPWIVEAACGRAADRGHCVSTF
jgi:hypothetical protein